MHWYNRTNKEWDYKDDQNYEDLQVVRLRYNFGPAIYKNKYSLVQLITRISTVWSSYLQE